MICVQLKNVVDEKISKENKRAINLFHVQEIAAEDIVHIIATPEDKSIQRNTPAS